MVSNLGFSPGLVSRNLRYAMACRSVAATINAALFAVPGSAPRKRHHSLTIPEYVTRVAGDFSDRNAEIRSQTR